MSAISMQGWPVVEVEFLKPATDEQAEQWFADMDALIERNQPFTMMIHARPNSEFSPQARKAMSLWFKDRKAPLALLCKGVARLVPDEAAGQRVVSENMQAAMPFPMKAFVMENNSTTNDAKDWLIQQLGSDITDNE